MRLFLLFSLIQGSVFAYSFRACDSWWYDSSVHGYVCSYLGQYVDVRTKDASDARLAADKWGWLEYQVVNNCPPQDARCVGLAVVQALRAEEIPEKVPELAKTELGVAPGSVPEDSEGDLFVHVRCPVCSKEKLILQSP